MVACTGSQRLLRACLVPLLSGRKEVRGPPWLVLHSFLGSRLDTKSRVSYSSRFVLGVCLTAGTTPFKLCLSVNSYILIFLKSLGITWCFVGILKEDDCYRKNCCLARVGSPFLYNPSWQREPFQVPFSEALRLLPSSGTVPFSSLWHTSVGQYFPSLWRCGRVAGGVIVPFRSLWPQVLTEINLRWQKFILAYSFKGLQSMMAEKAYWNRWVHRAGGCSDHSGTGRGSCDGWVTGSRFLVRIL